MTVSSRLGPANCLLGSFGDDETPHCTSPTLRRRLRSCRIHTRPDAHRPATSNPGRPLDRAINHEIHLCTFTSPLRPSPVDVANNPNLTYSALFTLTLPLSPD
ncbi:hypothetical protein VTH06DRAFT_352 [Thermothelomyces fergusii]